MAPDGPAGEAGLRQGDVIEKVDGELAESASELRTALNDDSSRPALVLVHRKDRTLFVTLERG